VEVPLSSEVQKTLRPVWLFVQHSRSRSTDLGLQNSYSPIEKLTQSVGFSLTART